jgi:cytochrome c-type biogenesis protein CcmH
MTTTPTTTARQRSALARPSAIVAVAVFLVVAVVWAVAAVRESRPPTLDQRVASIAAQVQIPGGFGESAATSSSPVAQEMRDLIRQDLLQGMSEQQILDYFRARYGDGILETPPAQGFDLLIWLPPVVLTLILIYLAVALTRRRPAMPVAPAAVDAPPDATAAVGAGGGEPELRELLRRELAEAEGYADPREGRVR